MLLSGVPPFYGPDDKATLQSVRQGKWKFNSSLFRPVSVAAKNFITACLDRNVSTRPSASSAMKHQWFQMLRTKDAPDAVSLDVIDRIRGFTKRSALSRMCMEVVAHCLGAAQITNMREEFGKFDVNNTGEITFADMRNVLRSLVGTGDLTEEEIERIFTGIDFDETGVVQYHEFIAATVSRKVITEENMRIAFDRISGDEDFITASDLCDLLGYEMSNDQVASVLKEIQALPSKKLDYNQFKRIMLGGIVNPVVQRRSAFFQRDRPSKRTASILEAREVAASRAASVVMGPAVDAAAAAVAIVAKLSNVEAAEYSKAVAEAAAESAAAESTEAAPAAAAIATATPSTQATATATPAPAPAPASAAMKDQEDIRPAAAVR